MYFWYTEEIIPEGVGFSHLARFILFSWASPFFVPFWALCITAGWLSRDGSGSAMPLPPP